MHNALHLSRTEIARLLDPLSWPWIASLQSSALDLMKKKNKKETLNFRVSAEFKQRLIEQAEKERRSLTNYLENTLTKLWDEREPSTAKKDETRRKL
jgi:hypothetical protein